MSQTNVLLRTHFLLGTGIIFISPEGTGKLLYSFALLFSGFFPGLVGVKLFVCVYFDNNYAVSAYKYDGVK